MSDDLERLTRWENSGATWRVLARTPDSLEVALCSCDAGEEVDRFWSADLRLRAYVGDRSRSDEQASQDCA